MDQVIAEQHGLKSTVDELADVRFELRNAKALADKLQTLLDSKTHAYEAMHNEAQHLSNQIDTMRKSHEFIHHKLQCAGDRLDAVMTILIQHADEEVVEAAELCVDGPDQIARNIIDKLITAPEPDIDTVPLADLLEAVGTYLEHDQAVTIRGSFEAVRHVQIHAMGLTFAVETHEASESLTKLQELGGCLVVEAAR